MDKKMDPSIRREGYFVLTRVFPHLSDLFVPCLRLPCECTNLEKTYVNENIKLATAAQVELRGIINSLGSLADCDSDH